MMKHTALLTLPVLLLAACTQVTNPPAAPKPPRLTERPPYSIAPAPDSPEAPCPEMDEQALEGLRDYFKAHPDAAKDEALMALCIRHYSVYEYPKSLRYLLSQGANPNGRDAQGRTPLDFAYYHDWPEGIRILRKAGATEHTPGRSFTEKRELNSKHLCPRYNHSPIPGTIRVDTTPFFIWKDPGPDSPRGGCICLDCGAPE